MICFIHPVEMQLTSLCLTLVKQASQVMRSCNPQLNSFLTYVTKQLLKKKKSRFSRGDIQNKRHCRIRMCSMSVRTSPLIPSLPNADSARSRARMIWWITSVILVDPMVSSWCRAWDILWAITWSLTAITPVPMLTSWQRDLLDTYWLPRPALSCVMSSVASSTMLLLPLIWLATRTVLELERNCALASNRLQRIFHTYVYLCELKQNDLISNSMLRDYYKQAKLHVATCSHCGDMGLWHAVGKQCVFLYSQCLLLLPVHLVKAKKDRTQRKETLQNRKKEIGKKAKSQFYERDQIGK